MLEAQEMFRTANKVTRPEKALILGFMAGSRGTFIFVDLLCARYFSITLDCFSCLQIILVRSWATLLQ